MGAAAWLLVFYWVVSGHKRVGAKEIPLASAEEWKDERRWKNRAGWKMKKRKTGAWPSAKGPCGPPPTPFAQLPGMFRTLGCWPSTVLVLSPCLHMPRYGCGPYTRGWRATDCRFEPGALVECRHGDGDGNWSHGTVTTSAEAIKVRVESSDGSGPNDESFNPHQVRRRGALPLRGYSCTHIACVCNSLELARRNARPPNSGKGRA